MGAGSGSDPRIDPRLTEELRRLIDDCRSTCLWFLRAGFVPQTTEEARQVLAWIERHGDVAAFRRAGELRRWLSHV
jgi:hypothetical protein